MERSVIGSPDVDVASLRGLIEDLHANDITPLDAVSHGTHPWSYISPKDKSRGFRLGWFPTRGDMNLIVSAPGLLVAVEAFLETLALIAGGSCTAERKYVTDYDPAGNTYEEVECIDDDQRTNRELWCGRCQARAALGGQKT